MNNNISWPTAQQVHVFMHADTHIKKGWEALLNQKTSIPDASNEWFPFPNALYLFLFIGRYDPSLAITRNIIKYFIKILKTLQNQGFIAPIYKIPSDGSEIERLWEHLPQLPLGM